VKTSSFTVAVAAVALAALAAAPPARADDGRYQRENEIAIGGEGGWDYLTVDASAHRLYVAHAARVVVIDLEKNTVVGAIERVSGVHGIAIAPDLGRGFVTDGRTDTVSVVDLKTLAIEGSVPAGRNPDAIVYEPSRREVWAFNHTGHSATVFDAASGEVRTTIPLPGVAEFAVLDARAGRIDVNVEDASLVAAIDIATHAVVARWPLAPGEEPTGLALDPKGRRLFAACGNGRLVMLDADAGRVLASVAIGPGADGAAFDPGTGLAFASSSDGTLTVARPEGTKLEVVQKVATPPRSRTMTLDPTTHRLYVAAADFGPRPAGARWPPVLSGTFRVVVYGLTNP
jgi:YVTN family beta-propeller protein